MGGISITQLLIIAAIVVILFGTKKLRGLGEDLGASIKGFKKSIHEDYNQTQKSSEALFQDVEFTTSPIEQNAEEKRLSEVKKRDKEQV